MSVELLWKTLQ